MSETAPSTKRLLNRIANALGTEATSFLNCDGLPSSALEMLELIEAFERITDPKDRSTCLNFIRSVVARQGPSDKGPDIENFGSQ